MPSCYKCERVLSSADMRRTTKILAAGEQAWICRDAFNCKIVRKERRRRK